MREENHLDMHALRWAVASATVALFASACGGGTAPGTEARQAETKLEARPAAKASGCRPGTHALGIREGRKALLHITPEEDGRRERALLLALHGAGSGGAKGGLWIFRRVQKTPGLVIVAPAAEGSTWTLDRTDVAFVDESLRRAFARCRIDPQRIAVGGFSAGAGMALQLGLTNGDLFSGIVALSPGGPLPGRRVGKPELFVAHGTKDDVIPIGRGGDELVPRLEDEGYEVTYRRFEGGHRVLPDVAANAVRQLLLGLE